YSTSSFLSIHLFPPLPPPPPPPTLFPYTTLFRSLARPRGRRPAPRCLHRGAPARGGGGDPRQSEPVRVGELPLDPFVERLERSRWPVPQSLCARSDAVRLELRLGGRGLRQSLRGRDRDRDRRIDRLPIHLLRHR